MSWWNPFTWFKKKRLYSSNNIKIDAKIEKKRLEDTIPLPISSVDKTQTVAPRGRVRVRNVQWKPSKKKFKHTLNHHKRVLRASNTVFDDYKDELGGYYKKLKDILATIDYCYGHNLDLQNVKNHSIYTVKVTAGLNQLRPINRKLLKMTPIIKKLQLDSDTKKQFTVLKNYVKDMIAYLEIVSKTKEFKN